MLVAANPVGDFVNAHPTVKMLALSFLLLVGVALVADGLHCNWSRGAASGRSDPLMMAV